MLPYEKDCILSRVCNFLTLCTVPYVNFVTSALALQLAHARLAGETVRINTQYDMWQLGTFVYEVATDTPYWPQNMSDEQVLNVLARDNARLPHEERPVPQELVQRILSQLLTRQPTHRLNAESLRKVLEQEEESSTLAATINPGYARTEAPIELPT
jgi:serine/threonine protein kinase